MFDITKMLDKFFKTTKLTVRQTAGEERKDTMFDTMKVAKRIRDGRIAKNMTQMNLADAMGVSYQAVSNWERGNSMPDISKLEDLCRTLDLTVSGLLGMEGPETAAVNKVLQGDEESLTVEELTEIAPMLPPDQVKRQTEKTAGDKKQKFNIKALTEIAPYLDEDTLDWVVRQCDVELDKELLDGLGCYLDDETLDALADMQIAKGNVKCLSGLYCYMDDKTVRKIARALMASGDLEELRNAAMFL